jgi:hypothetical protein
MLLNTFPNICISIIKDVKNFLGFLFFEKFQKVTCNKSQKKAKSPMY